MLMLVVVPAMEGAVPDAAATFEAESAREVALSSSSSGVYAKLERVGRI
jgi:hypothetical protein